MAGFYNLDHKEVIRIKVKKCDGRMQPEYKKFSIDPQITSFDMLRGILARAFEINSDFTISYLARDSEGQAVYLSMLSDWDMDAAFQCAADPCLKLKVDLRPFEEELEDWDVIAPAEIPQHRITSLLDKSLFGTITGTITQNLGKTVTSVKTAIGLKHTDEVIKPLKPPMSDMEFKNYMDSEGFMVRPNDFRLSVYQGGIEPSLRRVAWRHLLNIFPASMSGQCRFDYMKRKEEEYRKLREEWHVRFKNNTATEEVKYVASMVKKDVLRTDRCHGFYAGNDENENTLSLFHILVTYALTHPDVSYCQGMSDLASPLLYTQKDEGQAYVCFCALMNRLRSNFTVEGNAIMNKFKHLSDLLAMYDPPLQAYLVHNNAGDMFFCYRWFLLELKREFPFTDALYVLEVMWATLPPSPPEVELALVDPDYSCKLLSSSPCSPTFSLQHAMYAKLLAMRRVGALHRVARAAVPIQSVDLRTSANDNLNGESPGQIQLKPICFVASLDTSPADIEDKVADFPEVENPMTHSMQMKSNSIDQILQEDSSTENEEEEEISDGKFCKVNGNSIKNGSCGRNNKNNVKKCDSQSESDSVDVEHNMLTVPKDSCKDYHNTLQSIPVEESTSFNFSTIEDDRSDRSWSVNSAVSDCSNDSERQTQFSLSLDSNINNSLELVENLNNLNIADHFKGPVKTASDRSNVYYIKSEIQISKNDEEAHNESNSGIFQSMKRFLASPKRKQTSSPEVTSSPQSSPKRSAGLSCKQLSSSPILSPGQEDIPKLTKNLSDTQISDGKEATESLDSSINSASVSSSSHGPPPIRDPSKLPQPQDFGSGNPFLMFVCFTLLSQHRDKIIQQGMCYEDIAMYFDRLVRRHDANRVLHHARHLYTEYLRAQQANVEKEKDVDELGLSC
ncbi:unnamed protein product [Lymnaea stagnalis]|uniref:Rab-GAP TBC domain-containing protein n=1 Tax=Lymnaea stagnalis TaxID=6523 RepID=A0AAV2IDD0_LYMST